MKCVLGFDGGGTKTDCVVLDTNGLLLGRGRGPASNPTRIGFPAAIAAIKETGAVALRAVPAPAEVYSVCASLAGTGQRENREQVRKLLRSEFPGALMDVRTDLELAVSTMKPGPAIALVIGTGSAAIGRDRNGKIARQGGLGPASGDEGSAFDIGKAATAVARLQDSSAAAELARQILLHLGCSNWTEVDLKSESQPDLVFPRVFPVVAAAADANNPLAQSVLEAAARKLATLTCRLAESLDLVKDNVALAKTGGTVGRSHFFDQALDRELLAKLPNAVLGVLDFDPAETAARLALEHLQGREGIAP